METEKKPDPDMSNYYGGLPGNPNLLARSSSEPWALPRLHFQPSLGTWRHAEKVISTVGVHPLKQKLRQGLRTSIHRVLATMKNSINWISVDYVRLGYKHLPGKSKVVILITVEWGQVTETDAQILVRDVIKECVK